MTRRKTTLPSGTTPSSSASPAVTSSIPTNQPIVQNPDPSSQNSPDSADMPEEATTTSAVEQNKESEQKTEVLPDPVAKRGRPKKAVDPEPVPETTPEPASEPEVESKPFFVFPEIHVEKIASFLRGKMSEYWNKPVYGKTHVWQTILTFGTLLPFIFALDFIFFIASLIGDTSTVHWAIDATVLWLVLFLASVSIFAITSHETYIADELDRIDLTTGLSVVRVKADKITIAGINNSRVDISRAELLLLIRSKKVHRFAGMGTLSKKTDTPSIETSTVPSIAAASPSTIEKAAPV